MKVVQYTVFPIAGLIDKYQKEKFGVLNANKQSVSTFWKTVEDS